jgi:hypothetical protein
VVRRSDEAPPHEIDGFVLRQNSHGYAIVELDYWAHPEKSKPGWIDEEAGRYPNIRQFRREILRDWTTAPGQAFYPEFQEAKERYIYSIPTLLDGAPVFRGYDFGFHRPVCMWAQVTQGGRVAFLREYCARNTDAHNFCDLVRYLSGEVDIEYLKRHQRTRALQHVMEIREKGEYPEPPWFEGITNWKDHCGHEGNIGHSILSEKRERNDVQVFASGGIQIAHQYYPPSRREYVFRRLLGIAGDGHPLLVIDPACKNFIAAMAGGLAYPLPTPATPQPTDPAKDGWYDNFHDAAGYAAINMVDVAETHSVGIHHEWRGRVLEEVSDNPDLLESKDLRREDYW